MRDQFTLSLLAPAFTECGINVGVIREVFRDFDIYAGMFVETEASRTNRERETIRNWGWKNLELLFMYVVRYLGSSTGSVDYYFVCSCVLCASVGNFRLLRSAICYFEG